MFFFTFAYHVLIPNFSFFNFPWAWVGEAERVMTGSWELLLMRNVVYRLSYEFRKSIELVKKSLRLIFFLKD